LRRPANKYTINESWKHRITFKRYKLAIVKYHPVGYYLHIFEGSALEPVNIGKSETEILRSTINNRQENEEKFLVTLPT
jgi:hypothetical protein